MQRLTRLLLAGVLSLSVGACCTPALIGSQPVALRPQETSMWCWAAGGEMCMEFLGTSVDQCDEANQRFGLTTCCNNPVPGTCVVGGWPEFDKYGFSFATTAWGVPLTFEEVKDQIYCDKKPFCFSWGWTGGGGHLMVVVGYITLGGEDYVVVNDPWPPNQGAQYVITYAEFVSAANHTHWIDHYNITKI